MKTRQDGAARHGWKVRLVKGLYRGGFEKEDVQQLFRLIDWLMVLPLELQGIFRDEIYEFEMEKRMPYVTSIESMAEEKGREEGREEGREKGREEGRQEARAIGELLGRIHAYQELLGQPLSPVAQLLTRPLEELKRQAEEFKQQLNR